jgi:hypothetical protein
MKNFHFLTLTALLFSGLSVAADNPTSVTAQIINQNPVSYKGKQVMLTGQIDRSLGNGAYVICDRNTAKSEDDSHHILVFTSGVSAKNADSKQQA